MSGVLQLGVGGQVEVGGNGAGAACDDRGGVPCRPKAGLEGVCDGNVVGRKG